MSRPKAGEGASKYAHFSYPSVVNKCKPVSLVWQQLDFEHVASLCHSSRSHKIATFEIVHLACQQAL